MWKEDEENDKNDKNVEKLVATSSDILKFEICYQITMYISYHCFK